MIDRIEEALAGTAVRSFRGGAGGGVRGDGPHPGEAFGGEVPVAGSGRGARRRRSGRSSPPRRWAGRKGSRFSSRRFRTGRRRSAGRPSGRFRRSRPRPSSRPCGRCSRRRRGWCWATSSRRWAPPGRKELAPHVEKYPRPPRPGGPGEGGDACSRLADGAGWEKILRDAGDPDELVRAAVAEALGSWTSSRALSRASGGRRAPGRSPATRAGGAAGSRCPGSSGAASR